MTIMVFLLVVGSFTVVDSVNMKKISCSDIRKCSVKNAYNSIARVPKVPSTYISSFENAFLNDGTITRVKLLKRDFNRKLTIEQ